MSIPGQSGVFSFGLQSGQLPEKMRLEVDQIPWFRTRAPRIGLTTVQQQDVFPAETGGPIVPTGAFKAGQFGAGDVELIPRIENVLGLLLLGALGSVTTHANSIYDPQTESVSGHTGVNTHIFRFDQTSSFNLPWLALRKYVPGRTADDAYGEIFQDSMVRSLRLDVRAAGLLGATVSFQSVRVNYPLPAEVNAWTYQNSTEDSTSAPLSNIGHVRISGVKHPITQMTIELNNELTQPQQEMVISNFHPDTFVPLSRNLTMRIVVKWRNPDLYKQLLMGGTDKVDWDALPFIRDTAGAKEAFEASFYAPNNIPGTTTPYMLSVRANRVVMQVDRGGVELAAGQIIQVPYVIQVLEPAAGQDYCRFVLHNAATYALPETLTLTTDETFDYNVGGAVAEPLTTAATFTSGLTDLNGGRITAEIIAGAESGDVLAVGDIGTITSVAGEIQNSTTPIADATGGSGGTRLEINFDSASATPTAVESVIEALTFNNAAATVGTYRTVRVTVWNGQGAFVVRDININIAA
jgi:hypothetical protein